MLCPRAGLNRYRQPVCDLKKSIEVDVFFNDSKMEDIILSDAHLLYLRLRMDEDWQEHSNHMRIFPSAPPKHQRSSCHYWSPTITCSLCHGSRDAGLEDGHRSFNPRLVNETCHLELFYVVNGRYEMLVISKQAKKFVKRRKYTKYIILVDGQA